jgi:hypothetical protein
MILVPRISEPKLRLRCNYDSGNDVQHGKENGLHFSMSHLKHTESYGKKSFTIRLTFFHFVRSRIKMKLFSNTT